MTIQEAITRLREAIPHSSASVAIDLRVHGSDAGSRG